MIQQLMIGQRRKVYIPKKIQYGHYGGDILEGTIIKENKKSYEVQIEVQDGRIWVLVRKERINDYA